MQALQQHLNQIQSTITVTKPSLPSPTVPPPPVSSTKPSPKIATTWSSFVAEQDSWVQELIQNTFYDDG